MNFTRGILETRKQTYRHLRRILKCIPLEAPTVIELAPGKEIRVTLFDANHCIGAVMFLIEGDGKSILYTGDIRAESWLIDTMKQNPVLIPYAAGIKILDTIYLDTTFATKKKIYHEFPSKADRITELLK
jgi:DNA cross-link repair 1C protein